MVALLIVLVLIVAAGIAAAAGFTPDTRDPDYALGRLLDHRTPAPRADLHGAR